MPTGTCPKCGARFFGWALRNPEHQTCSFCDIELNVVEDDGEVSSNQNQPVSHDKVKHGTVKKEGI